MVPALYFGGALAQFGLAFGGFGMIFVWVFTLNADIASLWQFSGAVQTVGGYVDRSVETSFSEGGGQGSRGTPVYEIRFRFQHPDGARHNGVCYRTGWNPVPNQAVSVEFPQGEPEFARIVRTRRKPMGLFGLMPVVFPAIGFGMVAGGLVRGRKAHRMLREGRLAAGTLVAKEATNTRVNDQTVYELSFEFLDDQGEEHIASVKTHLTRKLEDDESELLLYDTARPTRAVLLDALPGSPRIDRNGRLRGQLRRGILSMFLPTVVVAGHTIAAIVLL